MQGINCTSDGDAGSHQGPERQPRISNSREPMTLQLEVKEEEAELREPRGHPPGRSRKPCPGRAGNTKTMDGSLACCLRPRGRRRNTLTFPIISALQSLFNYLTSSWSNQQEARRHNGGGEVTLAECKEAGEGRVRRMLGTQAWDHAMHL